MLPPSSSLTQTSRQIRTASVRLGEAARKRGAVVRQREAALERGARSADVTADAAGQA